jgi:hypothetical protein
VRLVLVLKAADLYFLAEPFLPKEVGSFGCPQGLISFALEPWIETDLLLIKYLLLE